MQLRSDADGKLQNVSGRCLILCSDHYVFSLRIPFIQITVQIRNDADGKLQKVSGRCLITSLALELPRKSVKHSSWKKSSYCFKS